MNDKEHFVRLFEIASLLNRQFSLHAVLHKSLEKTAEILGLDTGWIWLTEPDHKSVYLAASFNLPPALSKHPERLSGWCWCIKQYLSDEMDEAVNISEMACSRLKDVSSGANDLKFHATIPITINNQKVGLINLLSQETRKLDNRELTMLNTISELVGMTIQRTRLQPSSSDEGQTSEIIKKVSNGVLSPKIEAIIACLESSQSDADKLSAVLKTSKDIRQDLAMLSDETAVQQPAGFSKKEFLYPEMPVSKRELEVLQLVKEGMTNEQIGERLFIAERTVKFHLTSVLSKLQAKNRTEAVDVCLKRGLFNI